MLFQGEVNHRVCCAAAMTVFRNAAFRNAAPWHLRVLQAWAARRRDPKLIDTLCHTAVVSAASAGRFVQPIAVFSDVVPDGVLIRAVMQKEDAARNTSLPRSALREGTAVRDDIGAEKGHHRKMISTASRRWLFGFAVAIIGMIATPSVRAGAPLVLADPVVLLQQAWAHQSFGTATHYETVTVDGVPAIRAIGCESASGLYRDTPYRVEEHPWLEWTWRVDQLQRTADIRVKSREDFAAAIFLIFGRLSMVNREVPTLAYVWTSDRLPVAAVVDSPHHPGPSVASSFAAVEDTSGSGCASVAMCCRISGKRSGKNRPILSKLLRSSQTTTDRRTGGNVLWSRKGAPRGWSGWSVVAVLTPGPGSLVGLPSAVRRFASLGTDHELALGFCNPVRS